jgi:uncharacterized protein (DUF2141 family)
MNMKLFLSVAAFCAVSRACFGQQRLTIVAGNFKNDVGNAVVNLFRTHDDLPKTPFRTMTAKITNGRAVVTFEDVPAGYYAAILFHDENSNGVIDHRFGFPKEPMGFSNNWRLSLFSGMPTFEKLKFNVGESRSYTIMIQ